MQSLIKRAIEASINLGHHLRTPIPKMHREIFQFQERFNLLEKIPIFECSIN